MTSPSLAKAILVVALGMALGCSKKPAPTPVIADDPATESAVQETDPVTAPDFDPVSTTGASEQTRLSGIWLDDADPFNSIEISGNILTARYADEKYATTQVMMLKFVRDCEDQRVDAQSDFFILMPKYSTKAPLCYRLLTASETKLSYENVTRGAPLTFSRAR